MAVEEQDEVCGMEVEDEGRSSIYCDLFRILVEYDGNENVYARGFLCQPDRC